MSIDDPRVRTVAQGVAIALVVVVVQQWLWPAPAGVVVVGLLIGGLTALIALGLCLIYRANHVVNFAQGDLGAAPAILTSLLMVNKGWPWPLAVLAALVLSVAVGAAVERLLIRPFFRAPRLILTVVTIGVAQVLTAGGFLLARAFGVDSRSTFLPTRIPQPFELSFTIDPITFHAADLVTAIAVPVAVGGLLAFLRYTSLGVAIRASAERADRAWGLGIPVPRLQTIVWVTATVLSAVAVILRGSIVSLPIGGGLGPAILLRALAPAVIGKFENFGRVIAASLALGVVEQAIVWHTGSSLQVDVVLFLVVMGTLLVQHRQERARADDEVSSWSAAQPVRPIPRELADLPEVKWLRRGALAVVGAVLLGLPLVLDVAKTSLAGLLLVYCVLALSLVVLTGWAGQISLGHVGFMGLGAAVGGALTLNRHWDLPFALLAAGAAGALAALAVGIPALRIRGMYLAVSTLAFGLFTSSWVLSSDIVHWVPHVTDPIVRRPILARIDVQSERAFYYVCLAVLGLAMAMVHGVRQARAGRVLIASRDNNLAAQAYGISVMRARLTAFAMSGFLAAVAGALYVHHQGALSRTPYMPGESLRAFTMVVIGGLGSATGAIIGALYLNGLLWFARSVPSVLLQQLLAFAGTGIGLLVVLRLLPGGLATLVFGGRDRVLRRIATRRGIVVPSLLADVRATSGGDPPQRRVPPLTSPPTTGLLGVRSIEVSYGQVQVLFGVDLDVAEGETVALLGTNGAGKSTVFRAISGLAKPGAGSIVLGGKDITGLAPDRIAELGIIQVPGGQGVFPGLTVEENLRIAGWLHRRTPARVRESTDSVLEIFPALRERLGLRAALLSGGQQQMLALGMAFIARPRVLLIDELSLGLAPVVVQQLLQVVDRFRQDGTTIVLVEQSVNVALKVADRAYFLEKGEVRFSGRTGELLARPDLLRSVFLEGAAAGGETPQISARTRPRTPAASGAAPPILAVHGLTKRFGGVTAIDDVSLEVDRGEILGIIGPNGAGKTTVFNLISGFLRPDAGTVAIGGLDVTSHTADARARAGLGRSFQDARLFPTLTVAETIAVALEGSIAVRDPLAAALHLPEVRDAEHAVDLRVEELIELLGLGAYRDKFTGELSTGTRRIVDLAGVIASKPAVVLLDEPSSGIAQRETEALGPLLERIQEITGATMLVIEHDMPLLTAVSHRMLAMDTGRVIADGAPTEVLAHPDVVASYLGTDQQVINRSGPQAHRPPRRRHALVAP